MPTPAQDVWTDASPLHSTTVAQQNEAVSVISPHAIQSNLPVPSRLDTHGNIAENWKRWYKYRYGIPSKSHLASTSRKTKYAWQHLLRALDQTR